MFSSPSFSNFSSLRLTTSDDISRNETWSKSDLTYHVRTAYLFTKSDVKTILIPVTLFSSLLAPVNSYHRLFISFIWTWLHLLHFCIANQCSSVEEDLLNKPWRPLPSGRISSAQASHLRWALTPLCISFSLMHGSFGASLVLLIATSIYNDFGWHEHGLVKNFLNVVGYVAFEFGATVLSENEHRVDFDVVMALAISGMVIMTTVHAGDIPDVEGDLKEGRRTLPIIFPTLARPVLAMTLILWSSLGGYLLWSTSMISSILLCFLGLAVALRFLILKSHCQDKKSCLLYNIWLSGMHFAIAVASDRILWTVTSASF